MWCVVSGQPETRPNLLLLESLALSFGGEEIDPVESRS